MRPPPPFPNQSRPLIRTDPRSTKSRVTQQGRGPAHRGRLIIATSQLLNYRRSPKKSKGKFPRGAISFVLRRYVRRIPSIMAGPIWSCRILIVPHSTCSHPGSSAATAIPPGAPAAGPAVVRAGADRAKKTRHVIAPLFWRSKRGKPSCEGFPLLSVCRFGEPVIYITRQYGQIWSVAGRPAVRIRCADSLYMLYPHLVRRRPPMRSLATEEGGDVGPPVRLAMGWRWDGRGRRCNKGRWRFVCNS